MKCCFPVSDERLLVRFDSRIKLGMVVKTLRNDVRIIRFSVVMVADPVGRSEMIDKVR
jgi:hypothetical protein